MIEREFFAAIALGGGVPPMRRSSLSAAHRALSDDDGVRESVARLFGEDGDDDIVAAFHGLAVASAVAGTSAASIVVLLSSLSRAVEERLSSLLSSLLLALPEEAGHVAASEGAHRLGWLTTDSQPTILAVAAANGRMILSPTDNNGDGDDAYISVDPRDAGAHCRATSGGGGAKRKREDEDEDEPAHKRGRGGEPGHGLRAAGTPAVVIGVPFEELALSLDLHTRRALVVRRGFVYLPRSAWRSCVYAPLASAALSSGTEKLRRALVSKVVSASATESEASLCARIKKDETGELPPFPPPPPPPRPRLLSDEPYRVAILYSQAEGGLAPQRERRMAEALSRVVKRRFGLGVRTCQTTCTRGDGRLALATLECMCGLDAKNKGGKEEEEEESRGAPRTVEARPPSQAEEEEKTVSGVGLGEDNDTRARNASDPFGFLAVPVVKKTPPPEAEGPWLGRANPCLHGATCVYDKDVAYELCGGMRLDLARRGFLDDADAVRAPLLDEKLPHPRAYARDTGMRMHVLGARPDETVKTFVLDVYSGRWVEKEEETPDTKFFDGEKEEETPDTKFFDGEKELVDALRAAEETHTERWEDIADLVEAWTLGMPDVFTKARREMDTQTRRRRRANADLRGVFYRYFGEAIMHVVQTLSVAVLGHSFGHTGYAPGSLGHRRAARRRDGARACLSATRSTAAPAFEDDVSVALVPGHSRSLTPKASFGKLVELLGQRASVPPDIVGMIDDAIAFEVRRTLPPCLSLDITEGLHLKHVQRLVLQSVLSSGGFPLAFLFPFLDWMQSLDGEMHKSRRSIEQGVSRMVRSGQEYRVSCESMAGQGLCALANKHRTHARDELVDSACGATPGRSAGRVLESEANIALMKAPLLDIEDLPATGTCRFLSNCKAVEDAATHLPASTAVSSPLDFVCGGGIGSVPVPVSRAGA